MFIQKKYIPIEYTEAQAKIVYNLVCQDLFLYFCKKSDIKSFKLNSVRIEEAHPAGAMWCQESAVGKRRVTYSITMRRKAVQLTESQGDFIYTIAI